MEQKFALFVWAPIQNSLTNKGSVNVCECDTGELDAGEDSRAEEKGRGWGLPDEGDGNRRGLCMRSTGSMQSILRRIIRVRG